MEKPHYAKVRSPFDHLDTDILGDPCKSIQHLDQAMLLVNIKQEVCIKEQIYAIVASAVFKIWES